MSLLRIIANCFISVTPVGVLTHEFTCRNFHLSETRLVLERDQAKSNFSNFICQSFFVVSLDFFRIDRFPFSIAMEAPPHVHAEAPLKLLGFVERGVLQDGEYSLIF